MTVKDERLGAEGHREKEKVEFALRVYFRVGVDHLLVLGVIVIHVPCLPTPLTYLGLRAQINAFWQAIFHVERYRYAPPPV